MMFYLRLSLGATCSHPQSVGTVHFDPTVVSKLTKACSNYRAASSISKCKLNNQASYLVKTWWPWPDQQRTGQLSWTLLAVFYFSYPKPPMITRINQQSFKLGIRIDVEIHCVSVGWVDLPLEWRESKCRGWPVVWETRELGWSRVGLSPE